MIFIDLDMLINCVNLINDDKVNFVICYVNFIFS